jgi:vacuolar protein sorting-associated protein 26
MDGSPIKSINFFYNLDESVPIRIFLQAFNNLSSSYSNVNNKFSVQYFLSLVLVDHEDRRYFKQLEINLFRLNKRKNVSLDTQADQSQE